MKTTSRFACVGLLITLALASACKTEGHQQADSTAMSMDGLRVAATALKEKVSAVATSLATVVEKADVDPKESFGQYDRNVTTLKDGLDRAESNLKSMKDQGQTYFAEWQKQAATISDPDLKKKADERREKLSKALSAVADAMTAARTEITPFVKSNEDLRTYLKNDLTPAGIKSISDKSKQAGKDAKSIGKKLDEVVEALDKGAPEFKTAKPPPPPAEKKG
jgi:predicted  nucleic acid-binding Zn-ribbon protein